MPCFGAPERGVFGSVLAEICQAVQWVWRSPSRWPGAADRQRGAFAAVFARSWFGSQWTQGAMCICVPSNKHWLGGCTVCGRFSLKWSPLVIIYFWFRSGTAFVGDLALQNNISIWKADAVHGAGVSHTGTRGYGLLPSLWYGHFLWCDGSVTRVQIRMTMGHTRQ